MNYNRLRQICSKRYVCSGGYVYIANTMHDRNIYKVGTTINLKTREYTLRSEQGIDEIIYSYKTKNYKRVE